MTCNVCREEGHVATKCSKKGTCFNCHQPGHLSRDCPDRSYGRISWGQQSKGVSLVSEPDGAAGGGSPAVEAPHTEPVSVVGVGPLGQTFSSPDPLHLVGVVLRTVGLPLSRFLTVNFL